METDEQKMASRKILILLAIILFILSLLAFVFTVFMLRRSESNTNNKLLNFKIANKPRFDDSFLDKGM